MDQEIKSDVENKPVPEVMASDVPQLESVSPEIMAKLKSPKKGIGKTVIVSLLVVLLAASGAAAYVWRDIAARNSEKAQVANIATLDEKIKGLEADLLVANGGVATPNTGTGCCTGVAPDATTIANIKASITSGNTAALEGYMADAVKVVLAMAEGVAPGTPTEAVTRITEFISAATAPWNFEKTADELGQYAVGGYGPYFPAIAVVGMSANSKVITFDFDCDGKISRVFMASDASILQ
jgi:hypothetical protein